MPRKERVASPKHPLTVLFHNTITARMLRLLIVGGRHHASRVHDGVSPPLRAREPFPLAQDLDKLATDIEGEGRKRKIGKLKASVLAWTVLIALLGRHAHAEPNTTVYDVPTTMGATTERNTTPCGAEVRSWLESFVAGVQIIVVRNREHIAITYLDATRIPDDEYKSGDLLFGFWVQKTKTIYVALEGDAVHPKVTVAFIIQDEDTTCYEKWEGLGLRR